MKISDFTLLLQLTDLIGCLQKSRLTLDLTVTVTAKAKVDEMPYEQRDLNDKNDISFKISVSDICQD